jgi:hypothetical protein
MGFLSLTDFQGGKYNIPDAGSNLRNADVTLMINAYENKYIYLLLGKTEGQKIITYGPAGTGNTDYDYIIAPFSSDNLNSCEPYLIQSLGLKEYLKAAVFYEYVKNSLRMTQAGPAKVEAETVKTTSPMDSLRYAENKFNDVLETIEAIQWYCTDNDDAFPDYNGQTITVKISNFL